MTKAHHYNNLKLKYTIIYIENTIIIKYYNSI